MCECAPAGGVFVCIIGYAYQYPQSADLVPNLDDPSLRRFALFAGLLA